jgi:hypothetical protein
MRSHPNANKRAEIAEDKAAVTVAVSRMISNGVPLHAVMELLAEVMSDALACPLEVNDLLSIYGVHPRINERMEYIIARGLAENAGIECPESYSDLSGQTTRFRRVIANACSASMDAPKSQKKNVLAELRNLQCIYKPIADSKGNDLVVMRLIEDDADAAKPYLRFTIYEIKDHKKMNKCQVDPVVANLVAARVSFEERMATAYAPAVEGGILGQTKFRSVLIINGRVGRNVQSVYTIDGHKCRVLSGDAVVNIMFSDSAHRSIYKNQIRRAAAEHD